MHIALGAAVLAGTAGVGLWGAWLWWRALAVPAFWPVLRVVQGLLVVQLLLGGVLLALGRSPAELHVLYGALPVAVSFVAEQLRIASAESVLERHGLEAARDMEALPATQQHVIVLEIVRRETGVMSAACLVAFLLALRAAGVAGEWLPI